jgi:hypothetical protein
MACAGHDTGDEPYRSVSVFRAAGITAEPTLPVISQIEVIVARSDQRVVRAANDIDF